MSQNFAGYTSRPFIGPLVGQDVGICTPSKYNPRVVKCIIDWSKYPKGCCEIDLRGGIVNPIDFIRSVVVDNVSRLSTGTLFFPDTQFIIEYQPDAVISGFALTFQLRCLVFNSRPTETGFTTIFFANFLVDSYSQIAQPNSVDLWQVTSDPVFGQAIYHAPVLGSQNQQILISLSDTVSQTNIMQSPNSQGKYYITGMEAYAFGSYSDALAPKEMKVVIKDLTAGTVPYYLEWIAPNDPSIVSRQNLIINTMKFIPLDSLHIYVMQNLNNTTGGFVIWTIYYDWISFD